MTKDTFYFSHDYNARNDVKIKKLLAKHGYLGYGLFWAIIEDLYNNTNVLRLDYDTISFDLRCDKNIIYSIIHDFDLFVFDGETFGSLSVQKRLEERNAKSEKARKSVLKRWENKGKNTNVLQTNNECNTIKESKVNENKKKEIKINKENNIFLEKKINSDHSLDVGKMVNDENYRFADVGNTINNEGYRQEAEEKNYPPYSAAPPIKKEEKNENDFEAVLGGEKVEEVEYIANEEIGGKKRKKNSKKQIEKYINEFGQCVSQNENGEEVRWFGLDNSNNVGLTMAEMENLKNKYNYDKTSFFIGIELLSNYKLRYPEKAAKIKSDYLIMAGGGWVYKELVKNKKINNNQEKIDKIDKYEKLINETLKKYEK